MKKKFLALLGVMLLLSGCKTIPTLENGEQVIAELDGKNITVSELYEKLKESYGTDQLINMIDEWIADKEYPTDEEMNKYVDEQFEQAKEYYELYYGVDFATVLTTNGIESEDDYKKIILLGYKQNLIIEDYVASLITDKEIKDYYDKNVYGKITAKHILISPETTSEMDDDEIEKAEEEAYDLAKDLIKKLDKGEDFSKLAKEYSDDTVSAENGGALDPFDNNSGLVEEFFNAALELKDGKYSSKPVKSEFGYHIILKESTAEKPSLEDSKEDIIDALVEKKLADDTESTLSYKALANIRKKYNMNIIDSDISNQYNEVIKSYE